MRGKAALPREAPLTMPCKQAAVDRTIVGNKLWNRDGRDVQSGANYTRPITSLGRAGRDRMMLYRYEGASGEGARGCPYTAVELASPQRHARAAYIALRNAKCEFERAFISNGWQIKTLAAAQMIVAWRVCC